jgi:PKD repeat protein/DMSO/TMAO reductase YedYZ molybdopterin-dependent catalytic subunit
MNAFSTRCSISIAFILVAVLIIAPAMGAASTSVHIIKYANDGTTIINETTKDFQWMEANLPVLGDGVTHYYMQGPVFNSSITNKWNPEENDSAILTKDFGAAKGTDIKDLCNLVGGMSPGDYYVTLMASDGFSKQFAYSSIYNPPARAGPMVLTWYRTDLGYVNGSYATGMRNVMFADTTTNPWGNHVFGLWDMHETYPETFWYYYQPGQPSATGLSVQNIDRILIFSNDPAPPAPLAADFTANTTNGHIPLTVQFTDSSTGIPTSWAWDFNNDGIIDSTLQSPIYTYTTDGTYSLNLTVTNGSRVDSELKNNYIVASSSGSPEYSLLLTGDHPVTLTKAQIEAIVASGPNANWTDSTNLRTWQGIPLWYLAGAVDDSDTGFNFNSTRAAMNYVVQVRANDGFFKNFSSSTIASNNNYFIANTLNGTVIPFTDPTNPTKYWWPLKLAGSGPTGGNSVGNVTEIRLIGLPSTPSAPVAEFSANTTLGIVPLTVQFTDGSTGTPNAWSWDFNNDGIVDSTIQNPVYNYSTSGVYGVNLTVSNTVGSNSRLKTNYINVTQSSPVVVTLFDGTVTLTPNETFTQVAYNSGAIYTINRTTPLGALKAAATSAGFTYNVTDSRWTYDSVLLLDDVGPYLRKTPNYWYAYVNGVYKDGYQNTPNGLNVIGLVNNDQVNFYYAPKNDPDPTLNATVVVKIKVNTSSAPSADYTLSMKGNVTRTITKSQFEEALACVPSGHNVTWTDTNGSVWGGIPLWVLVGMVDDAESGSHYTFNDALATQGYTVKVKASDWDTSLASADIARDGGYLVANTLNGSALPTTTPSGKPCWPLMLKGSKVFGGQQVGGVNEIELVGLPQPPTGWTLTMEGDVTDVITQQYFEQAIVCHHNVTYTDSSARTWTGVPLWDLVGSVDDIETSSHWTFNDTRANVSGYTVRVIAGDGYNATFTSLSVSHNNGFIVANTLNGTALSGSNGNLKLVGPATTSGGQRVGNVTKIRLEGLPSYPAGAYNLTLKGRISDVITQPELEEWIAHHQATYTDGNSNVYTGIPLWRLMGWVDDRIPHGPDGFNDAAAAAGYKVIVKAGDGYSKEFTSTAIGKNDNFIIANIMNGVPLPTTGSHPPWPLRLVGSGATGGNSVGNLVEIELTDFQTPSTAPALHLVKYGTDGVTIINETNVTYEWMEQNLAVIGDGTTAYKFEGLTLNASNLWDPEETYPGGYKISNVVKGTRIKDLADYIGGMGSGTEIVFVASDGFETTLPYSSIYTNPAVQEHQGDAVLAWWGDGKYVPDYADGMRLFFMPADHVFGQWDMHESLAEKYWRYNYQNGINYPSCAGLSAKLITTVKIYSTPESDWTLQLDGRDIGGINYTVSKPYFEEALACTFGSNHDATYTDSSGRVWEGMPLWFLCGFVDDADQHSPNSYNYTKALSGYNVTITGTDGYNYTFDSRSTIRNSNYIVANSLNGTHINSFDSSWPLRLVGMNVTGSKVVKKIASIKLTPLTTEPSINLTKLGVTNGVDWYIDVNGDGSYNSVTEHKTWGALGWTPVVGDWDGMGTTKMGVTNGVDWYIDVNGDGSYNSVTEHKTWGALGWTPVVGDWDGMGTTKMGVMNGVDWYIDVNGDGTYDSVTEHKAWGALGWTPVVGDWDGMGTTKMGVSNGVDWYIDVNGDGSYNSVTEHKTWGALGWTPVVGDWS